MAEQFARERLPEAEPADRTPAMTLGECIDLYAALREQSQQLEEQVRIVREQILAAMVERNLEEIRHGRYEAIRQVRRSQPRLNVERAEKLLAQHQRLRDCVVEKLDEGKTRQVLEELRAAGTISRREMPFDPTHIVEALIVRPVEGQEKEVG